MSLLCPILLFRCPGFSWLLYINVQVSRFVPFFTSSNEARAKPMRLIAELEYLV
jgi:hypothetical protein